MVLISCYLFCLLVRFIHCWGDFYKFKLNNGGIDDVGGDYSGDDDGGAFYGGDGVVCGGGGPGGDKESDGGLEWW